MTEDSTKPLSLKRELIDILLLPTVAAALLIALYLPSQLRESWPICRRVESERQCKINHARGEFFSLRVTHICFTPEGSRSFSVIKTTYGREWELDLNKENARWEVK